MTTRIIMHASLLFLAVTAAVALAGKASVLGLACVAAAIFLWRRKHRHLAGMPYLIALCAVAACAGAAGMHAKQTVRERQSVFAYEAEITVVGRITRIVEKETTVRIVLADSCCYQAASCAGLGTKQADTQIKKVGTVLVNVPLKNYIKSGAFYGAAIKAEGTVSPFLEAENDGAFDEKQYYESRGMYGKVKADHIKVLQKQQNPFAAFAAKFRQYLDGVYMVHLDSGQASVISSMLLGEKEGLEAEIKEMYQKAGIAHLLAISGLHVSMMGMLAFRLLSLMRLGRKPAAAGAMAAAVLYVWFSGMSVSAVRAGLMFAVMMLSYICGRKYEGMTALLAAAAVQAGMQPGLLQNSSFLYSYVAVAGIFLVGLPLSERWQKRLEEARGQRLRNCRKPHRRKKNLEKAVRGMAWKAVCSVSTALALSFAIQMMLLPLSMYFNYEVTWIGLLLNLVVLPLSGPLLFSALCAALLPVFFLPVQVILHIYEVLCSWACAFPKTSIVTGQPDVLQVVCAYLLLFAALYYLKTSGKEKRRLKAHPAFVVLAAAAILLCYRTPVGFELTMLSLGQGEGIFLRTDASHTCFFDGGSSSQSQVGTYQILPFLKARGVKKIDYWFVSHMDTDHVSGLMEVLDGGYPVRYLVLSKAYETTMQQQGRENDAEKEDGGAADRYQELKQSAAANGTELLFLSAGQKLVWQDTKIQVLSPEPATPVTDLNESSLVLFIADGVFSFFFGGDIGTGTEEDLVKKYDIPQADCFIANHHGSKYSNSETLLAELSPQIALISAGEHNRYGHPHEEALRRIREYCGQIWCSADCGQVTIKRARNSQHIKVHCKKKMKVESFFTTLLMILCEILPKKVE